MKGILMSIVWHCLVLTVLSQRSGTLPSLTYQGLQARNSKYRSPYIKSPEINLGIDRTTNSRLRYNPESSFDKRSGIENHLDAPIISQYPAYSINTLERRTPTQESRSSGRSHIGSSRAPMQRAASSSQSNQQAITENRSRNSSARLHRATNISRGRSRSPSPRLERALGIFRDRSRSPSPGFDRALDIFRDQNRSPSPGFDRALDIFRDRSRSPSPGFERALMELFGSPSRSPSPGSERALDPLRSPSPPRPASVASVLSGPASGATGTNNVFHEHASVPQGQYFIHQMRHPSHAIVAAHTDSPGFGIVTGRGQSAIATIDTTRGGMVLVKTEGSQGTHYTRYTPGQTQLAGVEGTRNRPAKMKAAFAGNVNISIKGMNP